ncbi:MAG: hypothetical protein IJT56_08470 [Clostridia bacterium]|nr:hypothetical protein [Clostridia bacterium]
MYKMRVISSFLAAAAVCSLFSGCAAVNEINRRLDSLAGSSGGSASGKDISGITTQELMAANRLPELLSDGRIIKATTTGSDPETRYSYYLMKDGKFAILGDQPYRFGFYDGLEFWKSEETGRTLFSYYYSGESGAIMRYSYENHISGVLEYYTDYDISLDDDGDIVVHSIMENGGFGHELTAVFDPSDLSMKRVSTSEIYSDGGGLASETTYEKISEGDIPSDLLELLSGATGGTKTVTYGEYGFTDGEFGLEKHTFTVPADWEYAVWDPESAWTDETCSVQYKSPGDGIDYTVIINAAKG